jgi:hypothetical protein
MRLQLSSSARASEKHESTSYCRPATRTALAFRSLVGPPAIETLPERLIQFLATVRDLCKRYADRTNFSFPTLLDVHWRGSGAIWYRLVEDDALKLPR